MVLMLSMVFGTTVIATTVESRAASDKYIITAVYDNLDDEDMYIFANRLENIGYSRDTVDTNVSYYSLKAYLQDSSIKTIYHTGHGGVGTISTADYTYSAGDATVRAENVIIATCLTLRSTTWKSMFGSTAKNIMGYTNNSYDGTDDTVADWTGYYLGQGYSYLYSWYYANSPISSLNDRWCAYVREGNSIVTYAPSRSYASANQVRAAGLHGEMIKENVKVSQDLLMDERTFEDQFNRDKAITISPVNNRNRMASMDFASAAAPVKANEVFLEKVTTSQSKAEEIAEAWLQDNGYSDKDITLDYISPVEATVDDDEAMTVGYIVRYARHIDGLNIRSNGAADHVSLLINGEEIVNVSEMWSDFQVASNEAITETKIMPVNRALTNAVSEISSQLKSGTVNFVAVNPCYSVVDGQIVPAYEFIDEQGMNAIVSAENGQFISAK